MSNYVSLCFVTSQILCGDPDTIGSLWDLTDTWYHLMVSTLLYTNPTAKLFHLAGAAQDAIENTRGNHSAITPLDRILLAAMEADIHQVRLCRCLLKLLLQL